jgi:hypothetical protein
LMNAITTSGITIMMIRNAGSLRSTRRS